MQTDKQFAISGDWALAADSLQWVLQRKHGPRWYAVSFVRSTKAVLARCMREKGTPPAAAARLLAELPGCFDEWSASHLEARHGLFHAPQPAVHPSSERLTDALANAFTGVPQ